MPTVIAVMLAAHFGFLVPIIIAVIVGTLLLLMLSLVVIVLAALDRMFRQLGAWLIGTIDAGIRRITPAKTPEWTRKCDRIAWIVCGSLLALPIGTLTVAIIASQFH